MRERQLTVTAVPRNWPARFPRSSRVFPRFDDRSVITVDRHTDSERRPFLATLRIQPASRIDLVDVRGRLRAEFGSAFARYPRAFYISGRTTAGYLAGAPRSSFITTAPPAGRYGAMWR